MGRGSAARRRDHVRLRARAQGDGRRPVGGECVGAARQAPLVERGRAPGGVQDLRRQGRGQGHLDGGLASQPPHHRVFLAEGVDGEPGERRAQGGAQVVRLRRRRGSGLRGAHSERRQVQRLDGEQRRGAPVSSICPREPGLTHRGYDRDVYGRKPDGQGCERRGRAVCHVRCDRQHLDCRRSQAVGRAQGHEGDSGRAHRHERGQIWLYDGCAPRPRHLRTRPPKAPRGVRTLPHLVHARMAAGGAARHIGVGGDGCVARMRSTANIRGGA